MQMTIINYSANPNWWKIDKVSKLMKMLNKFISNNHTYFMEINNVLTTLKDKTPIESKYKLHDFKYKDIIQITTDELLKLPIEDIQEVSNIILSNIDTASKEKDLILSPLQSISIMNKSKGIEKSNNSFKSQTPRQLKHVVKVKIKLKETINKSEV